MGFFNGGGSSIVAGDFATKEELETKVDKVTGKELSANDYTTVDKNKLNGIEVNANKYTHPTNHPATIITEDTTHKFVTDIEKTKWNGKADVKQATTTELGMIKKCDTQADSVATTIETLIVDFNGLLAKMKKAGLM